MSKGVPSKHRGEPPPSAAGLPTALLTWLPAVLAALVSANVLGNGRAYDDFWVLDRTREMMSSWTNFLTFRGLSFLTHAFDLALWDERYALHHLTNLALHVACTLLVTLLARRLTRSGVAALVTGALFAVHPVHVEAVASIGNRKDVVAMVAVFGSVLACLDARRPGRGLIVSLVLFGLGLFAKEAAAVGLVLLVPLALWIVRPQAPEVWTTARLRTTLLAFGGLGALGTLVFGAGHGAAFGASSITRITEGVCRNYSEVLRESLASVGDNARLLVFPLPLSPDYPPHGPHATGALLAGAIVLAALLGLIVFLWRRSPVAAYGLTWLVVLYLPSSNLVPLTRYFIAERYLYGPSFGLCLALGVAAARLWGAPGRPGQDNVRRLTGATLLALLALGALGTVRGNAAWRDESTLWHAALRANPRGSVRIFQNLATEQALQGDLVGAVENYRNALRVGPDDAVAGVGLATALYQDEQYTESAQVLRGVTRAHPDSDRPWALLGATRVLLGQPDSAMIAYRHAVALNDADPGARINLGALLADRGAPEEAARFLDDLVRRQPALPIAHVLSGAAALRAGDRASAEAHYREALRLGPTYPPAQVSLAWYLVSAPSPTPEQVAEGLNLARAANDAAAGGNPLLLECLATAELAAGDPSAALATAEALRRRATEIGDTPWQRRATRLVERVRAGGRSDPDRVILPSVAFLFPVAD